MINCFLTRIMQARALKKIPYSHHGKYVPLASARRTALVVNASDPGIAAAVDIFRKEMAACGVDFRCICVDLGKEPVDDPVFASSPGIVRILRKDINWYGLPREDISGGFTDKPYDILTDMSSGKRIFTIDYLLRRASASLRIGTGPADTVSHDMTVSGTGPDTSPEELAANIINYLKTIH